MARSTIATKALVFSLLVSSPHLAAAMTPMERLVIDVEAAAGRAVTPAGELVRLCADDLLCAGRILADELGPRARLQRVKHPGTDTIRRVRSRVSIVDQRVLADGVLYLKIDRFGRKAGEEIRDAFLGVSRSAPAPRSIALDLRANPGGDLGRMLSVAGVFTGAVRYALTLTDSSGMRGLDIPAATWRLPPGVAVQVLIGEGTASSAEIFAALLKAYRRAELVGAPTFGKTYLHRVVPLTHDWHLYVPAERVTIAGVDMAHGVTPDRASPSGDRP